MSEFSFFDEPKPITKDTKLGRSEPIETANEHFVSGNPIRAPFAEHLELTVFGLGCFWGAERKMWQQPGVHSTAVGYMGGETFNPSYKEVCSGFTGHCEVVLVAFDPKKTSYLELLKVFWESHDPTQGMRQGNDIGSQYRSALFASNSTQLEQAQLSAENYQKALANSDIKEEITTQIQMAANFYYAEDYHQQYLAKNPEGYCGIKGTGVSCAF